MVVSERLQTSHEGQNVLSAASCKHSKQAEKYFSNTVEFTLQHSSFPLVNTTKKLTSGVREYWFDMLSRTSKNTIELSCDITWNTVTNIKLIVQETREGFEVV